MSATPGPDWVEQARRFAAGLAAEHAAGRGLGDVLGGVLGTPAGSAATEQGGDCRWCPLCAGLAALRGRRPDLVEALADALTAAADSLRGSVHTPAGGDAGASHPEPTPRPEETVPQPAPAPPVQRIDVA